MYITIGCVRVTTVAGGKEIIITNCVCLQPYLSSMQCACAILSSVGCLALLYFSTLSHVRYDFRGGGGGITERNVCVL
jgi:hypothetical protein